MGKEYRAKVFKSGNSLALRLPKALGLQEGAEMVVREVQQGYSLEPVEKPRRKFNIAKVAGSARNMNYVELETRLFDPRPSAADEADKP